MFKNDANFKCRVLYEIHKLLKLLNTELYSSYYIILCTELLLYVQSF